MQKKQDQKDELFSQMMQKQFPSTTNNNNNDDDLLSLRYSEDIQGIIRNTHNSVEFNFELDLQDIQRQNSQIIQECNDKEIHQRKNRFQKYKQQANQQNNLEKNKSKYMKVFDEVFQIDEKNKPTVSTIQSLQIQNKEIILPKIQIKQKEIQNDDKQYQKNIKHISNTIIQKLQFPQLKVSPLNNNSSNISKQPPPFHLIQKQSHLTQPSIYLAEPSIQINQSSINSNEQSFSNQETSIQLPNKSIHIKTIDPSCKLISQQVFKNQYAQNSSGFPLKQKPKISFNNHQKMQNNTSKYKFSPSKIVQPTVKQTQTIFKPDLFIIPNAINMEKIIKNSNSLSKQTSLKNIHNQTISHNHTKIFTPRVSHVNLSGQIPQNNIHSFHNIHHQNQFSIYHQQPNLEQRVINRHNRQIILHSQAQIQERNPPFIRQMRKMNSWQPNFVFSGVMQRYRELQHHLKGSLDHGAITIKFLEEFYSNLQKKQKEKQNFIKRIQKKSFQDEFINNDWPNQLRIHNIDQIKPKQKFVARKFIHEDCKKALEGYYEAMYYYRSKQKNICLNTAQGRQNYQKIRAQLWQISSNLKMMSEDLYSLYIMTCSLPSYFYQYRQILINEDHRITADSESTNTDPIQRKMYEKLLKKIKSLQQNKDALTCSKVGKMVQEKLKVYLYRT